MQDASGKMKVESGEWKTESGKLKVGWLRKNHRKIEIISLYAMLFLWYDCGIGPENEMIIYGAQEIKKRS